MDELMSFQTKVYDWLNKPAGERDLEVGATILLQITRNRILHQNVVRRKNFEKIEYVLKKYLVENSIVVTQPDADTNDDNQDEDPDDAGSLTVEMRGKRKDHDALPENIQLIFVQNTEKYHLMRSLHEKLKLMSDDDTYSDEDRKPHLDELVKLDAEIRDAWEKYDGFKPEAGHVKGDHNPAGLDVQTVQKYRTYISRTAKKESVNDKEKVECLNRYNELIAHGQKVDQKIVDRLIELEVIPTTNGE